MTPFANGEEVQRSDPTTLPGSSVVESRQVGINQLVAFRYNGDDVRLPH